MCLGFAIDTRKIPLSVVKTAKMRLLIFGDLCVMIKIENDKVPSFI